ncbi:MAG: hypothetical protein IT210_17200 [Armatimonadetes bacterium]|nr:hypothetical protein [Armatimonadota bacterium]
MEDAELIINGIEALNNALGPSAALRFLSLLHKEQTDYVEISRKLYDGQTIEDIFQRARQNWKG